MLLHTMNLKAESEGRGTGTIFLTADNCNGLNKKRYLLWFLAWLVLSEKEKRIELNFFIPDMMQVIRDRSKMNSCTAFANVDWTDWNAFLNLFGVVPAGFNIQQYHVFIFDSATPGVLHAKKISTSNEECVFNLVKRGLDLNREIA
eukprot:IDg5760t1